MSKVKNIALKTAAKASVAAGVAGGLFFGLANPVMAQDTWMPAWLGTLIENLGFGSGGSGPIAQAKLIIQWAITALFVVVFIVAVVYSALAGIKFITSQGDASKLEESKGAVKAILMGFVAIIISIVGIFLVFWLFGISNDLNLTINNNVPTY